MTSNRPSVYNQSLKFIKRLDDLGLDQTSQYGTMIKT